MGGKGELASYVRIRAKSKKERDKLKDTIVAIIDEAFTPISIIALVDESSGRKGKRGKRKKKSGTY